MSCMNERQFKPRPTFHGRKHLFTIFEDFVVTLRIRIRSTLGMRIQAQTDILRPSI